MLDNITLDLRRGRMALQVTFALGVMLVAGAVALSPDASAANKKLRVGYTAIPLNIGIVVAQEQGFYKKNGLDVKLTPLQCSGCSLPALGKQYDIMTATVADFFQVTAKGLDPVIVGGGNVDFKGKAAPNLMTSKGITSFKQLKGKTIGSVAVGTGAQYASLIIALNKAGMKKTDVKVVQVPFPNMLSQLQAGRIDGALAVEPFVTNMRRAGFSGFTNTLLSVNNPAVGAMWAAKNAKVKKDPTTYRKWRKALIQATAFMKKNPDKARDSIVKNLKQTTANAALTQFDSLYPTLKKPWLNNWIKPMEGVGLIKKGKVNPKKNYLFK